MAGATRGVGEAVRQGLQQFARRIGGRRRSGREIDADFRQVLMAARKRFGEFLVRTNSLANCVRLRPFAQSAKLSLSTTWIARAFWPRSGTRNCAKSVIVRP